MLVKFYALFSDKYWPSHKYGFKFAYAIKVQRKSWRIKKYGMKKWAIRKASWSPEKEDNWCKIT